ncbi:MAG: hypothetical protein Q9182_005288 [Xanthomendoza sp. 2 TL-2023]
MSSTDNQFAPTEAPSHRSYFHVGGHYRNVGDAESQHVITGQMYVEKSTPFDGVKRPWPLVFIHGASQTGTVSRISFSLLVAQSTVDGTRRWLELDAYIEKYLNFLNTPDGRKGWASWLLDQGYIIYIIDQTCRGRSAHDLSNGPTITYPAELAEKRWTACRDYNLWLEAARHTQWPGSGHMGDAIFDAYYASTVPSLADHAAEQFLMRSSGACLLDRIGPAILITHSYMAGYGRTTTLRAWNVKRFGITDVALAYDPPISRAPDDERPLQTQSYQAPNGRTYTLQQEPARRLANLHNIPVLVDTGEASSHASYDDFTVQFLRQAGVSVEHFKLAEKGIYGNGHLQFLETNNLEIIELLEEWIAKIVSLSTIRSLAQTARSP